MLGAQNAKTKHPTNLIPPKLQRIPKSDGTDAQTRSPSRTAKVPSATPSLPLNIDKKDSGWFPQTENDFLQSHDGTVPKPAQNIAVMGGKRYIVVPKNNAMAVQPAITVKPDMIGDKPPTLHDGSLIDISNTVDNAITKLRAPPPKHPDTDLKPAVEFEKAKVTPDKETEPAKDDAETCLTDIASVADVDEITEVPGNKDAAKEIDRPIENVSDNESSTANVDHAPESETAHTSCRSSENESAASAHIESIPKALETTTAEPTDTLPDCQPSLSSNASTKKVKGRM